MTKVYQVRIDSRVAKELRQVPQSDAQRILAAIDSLRQEPRPPGATKLVQQPGWRLRVGSYRILYEINDDALVVTVFRAGHRRDIYRRHGS